MLNTARHNERSPVEQFRFEQPQRNKKSRCARSYANGFRRVAYVAGCQRGVQMNVEGECSVYLSAYLTRTKQEITMSVSRAERGQSLWTKAC